MPHDAGHHVGGGLRHKFSHCHSEVRWLAKPIQRQRWGEQTQDPALAWQDDRSNVQEWSDHYRLYPERLYLYHESC